MIAWLRRKLADTVGNLTYSFTEPRANYRMSTQAKASTAEAG